MQAFGVSDHWQESPGWGECRFARLRAYPPERDSGRAAAGLSLGGGFVYGRTGCGEGMRMRQGIAAILLSVLCACTPPLGREGPLPPAGGALADASFTFAVAPAAGDPVASEAVLLVRRALVAKGYREAPDARYRLEIGFAIAPPQVAVSGENDASGRRGEAGNPILLCRPHRYVLTAGMIDRTNGAVLFRNATAARHCGSSLGKLLPRMVDAAINEAASPRRASGS